MGHPVYGERVSICFYAFPRDIFLLHLSSYVHRAGSMQKYRMRLHYILCVFFFFLEYRVLSCNPNFGKFRANDRIQAQMRVKYSLISLFNQTLEARCKPGTLTSGVGRPESVKRILVGRFGGVLPGTQTNDGLVNALR